MLFRNRLPHVVLATLVVGCGGDIESVDESYVQPDTDFVVPVPEDVYTAGIMSAAAAARAANTPQTVYLAFDGASVRPGRCSDAVDNCSFIVQHQQQVPALDWSRYGSSKAKVVDGLLTRLTSYFAPYNVRLTLTRPQADYTMVLVGGKSSLAGLSASTLGVAPLDCGNANRSDISFVFSDQSPQGLENLAETIAHELGHSFGLSHVTQRGDVMYPTVMTPASFGRTAVPVHGGQGCSGATTQNDHNLLLKNLGGALSTPPATQPPAETPAPGPQLTLLSPTANQVFAAGTTLSIRVEIKSQEPVDKLEIFWLSSGQVFTYAGLDEGTYTFRIRVGTGQRSFYVRITDQQGKTAQTPTAAVKFQ